MSIGNSIFHTTKRRAVLWSFGGIFLVFTVMLLYPYLWFKWGFMPTVDHANVGSFRDYYSTIAALLAVAVNMFAVILGGFYYLDRNIIEDRRKVEEKRDQIVSQLIEIFKEYEDATRKYMTLRDQGNSVIRNGQQMIREKQEIFEEILEASVRKLSARPELPRFLVANAFFEKSPAMDIEKFRTLSDSDIFLFLDSFTDKIKDVRRAIRNI